VAKLVTWETVQAPAVRHDGLVVTPESRLARLRLPFGWLVWHRPLAVLVDRADGSRERVPIPDPTLSWLTRLAIAALLIGLITPKERYR
jgi:hypothetical protein